MSWDRVDLVAGSKLAVLRVVGLVTVNKLDPSKKKLAKTMGIELGNVIL